MKKFRVVGILSASVDLGVYEAESEKEAIELAYSSDTANSNPTLCHKCAHEVEIGDIYKEEVFEVE